MTLLINFFYDICVPYVCRYWFEVDSNHVVLKKVAAVMRAENGIMMYVKRR